MNTIVLVYLPKLSAAEIALLEDLSDVGIKAFIHSGITTTYSRLRFIERPDLESNGFTVWDFSEQAPGENSSTYKGRLQAEVTTTLNLIKNGARDCAFISEAGFQVLNSTQEFQKS